jgi:N,N'-diacetyllegionaminate synthase
MTIKKIKLFSKNRIFVIAEMANSHEGNIAKAKQIVTAAYESKADAIKFQKFKAEELLTKSHSQFKHFKKLEMSNHEWKELINFAKKMKLKVFVDIFGISSARFISKLPVDGFKIHSSDLTNPELLHFFSNISTPILISTAGCYPNELDEALKILRKKPKEMALLHGFQGFPTKIEDSNLKRLVTLKKRYDLPVGLMDHVSGDSKMALILTQLGISFGARIIEKHITLNRTEKGIDYYSSLNPDEFKELMSIIRLTEKSLGSDDFIFSKNELEYRSKQKKKTIAKKNIKKGEKFKKSQFEFKRIETKEESIPYYDLERMIASKNISKGSTLNHNLCKKNPKISAVIACRVGSDRLFAKPIQHLLNNSILEHQINQIKTSKFLEDIVLAISEDPGNEIFVEFAKKHNLKFVLGDDTDVLKRLIDGAKYVDADIIFRVTSENPFLYWEGIDTIIKKHLNGNFDFSFFKDLPIGSSYEIINIETLKKSHRQGTKKHRSELCSLYVFEHKKSFKIQALLPPKELRHSSLRLTVDTPEDLTLARIIYKNLGNNLKPIPLQKIIKFLMKNPQLKIINSEIPLGVTRIWD